MGLGPSPGLFASFFYLYFIGSLFIQDYTEKFAPLSLCLKLLPSGIHFLLQVPPGFHCFLEGHPGLCPALLSLPHKDTQKDNA